MAFGQQAGPPASAKEVEELASLLDQAGYASFREARHIFGLTQRQASGKFTRDEAEELLARLQTESTGEPVAPVRSHDRRAPRPADRRSELLATVASEELADELVRRGWLCMPPG